jgi:hypothetical protein
VHERRGRDLIRHADKRQHQAATEPFVVQELVELVDSSRSINLCE